MSDKKKIRVTNISNLVMPPRGIALDYGGRIISCGRSETLSVDAIDSLLEMWIEKRWARVQNAEDGTQLGTQPESDMVGGPKFAEVAKEQIDQTPESEADEFEMDFDPTVAQEAQMPSGSENHKPIAGDLAQTQGRAKVSLGTETENLSHSGGLSPIPGDRPRPVDEADKFTVRAPRQQGVGGVIR